MYKKLYVGNEEGRACSRSGNVHYRTVYLTGELTEGADGGGARVCRMSVSMIGNRKTLCWSRAIFRSRRCR